MRPPEWVALVYFAYVALSAAVGRRLRERSRAFIAASATIGLVIVLSYARSPVGERVRDWTPGLFAVLGYWIPGRLAGRPLPGLERWLQALDAPLLPSLDRFVSRAPYALLVYLEAAYLCCYPLVPCAFAWLAINGHLEAADRYWTAVLLALYACYGPIVWAPTRPPRALEAATAIDVRKPALRRLNGRVLRDVSIQLNTFPSGHTAGALAAAAVVGTFMPASGVVVAVIAVSIAIASVVGRYHYGMDALAGAAVAGTAYGVSVWWFSGAP